MELPAAAAATNSLPWRQALVLGLLALVVYGLVAGERLLRPSTDPHFILQAEAFLAGQLELTRPPPHANDWASYQELTLVGGETLRGVYRTSGRGGQHRRFQTLDGRLLLLEPGQVQRTRTRTFVSFPSFPAVLMLPFVAVLGPRFSDVAFTVVLAALNVALLFLLLELLVVRGYSGRTRRENLLLAGLFAFGTVHFWCAVLGQVWFTALILGVTLSTLYLLAALDARHPLLAGLCLGLGMATRTPLAFASAFFLLQLWRPAGVWQLRRWRAWVRPLALFAAPILVIGLLLVAMNLARFGQPFEFGHTYLAGGTIPRIRTHGLFGWHFLGQNLAAALLLLPVFSLASPYVQLSRHGMSLLLSTPPLLLLATPRRWLLAAPPARGLGVALLVALGGVVLPLLFYQNTGHIQYGYRFSLDFTPLLWGLLALRRFRTGRLFGALAVLAVVVNLFGALTFKRYELLYDDHFLRLPW
ncbi:MAG: hypothetical protein RBU45_08215 [Myxococcota bacterium]|nr:hypothetical protein [Myxococcota bacterium]